MHALPRYLFTNRNYFFAGLFADELARSGVRHIVISPGSRSTPLAMTFAADPRFRCWSILDERSAGFFALGVGKATGVPAAVVCTSGTAAANLAPAAFEASNAGTPLLLLTADRPPELRDTGANQAIDQLKLFGSAVRWFVELATPEVSLDLAAYARSVGCRAVITSRSPHPGPVHVNFPFRDPLVPVEIAGEFPAALDRNTTVVAGRPGGAPYTTEPAFGIAPGEDSWDGFAAEIRSSQRGVILAGYIERPRDAGGGAVAMLAERTGYPVLAEPSSGRRWGPFPRTGVIAHYDAILRDEQFAAVHRPDLVVRVGAITTSKIAPAWIDASEAPQVAVAPPGSWPDPAHRTASFVRFDPTVTPAQLLTLSRERGDPWLAEWRRADDAAGDALRRFLASRDELFEGAVAVEAVDALPDGAVLFTASSMPVRDVEAFLPGDSRNVRFMMNRGANGIDGVTSTALGVLAAGERKPVVLLTGDVALLHDLGGLLAARRHGLPLVVVVVNNDGGGIFSFLPQAGYPEHFEEFFTTPHGLDLAAVAALFGFAHEAVDRPGATRTAVARAIASGGPAIVEARIPSIEGNVAAHREAWAAVSAALRAAGL
jgi:2-succinyl-5-enolpyruvyl-6-hydroxy-3-cyclohexene-1-carboxylate synthase